MERNNDKFEELKDLLYQKKYRVLRSELSEMNEVNIALFLEDLPAEKAIVAFRTLPKELAAEVFSQLDPDTQQYLVKSITDQEINQIMQDLDVDDAVDLVEELPANIVQRVLKLTCGDTRSLINQFLKYPENSAGSIMTAEFISLKRNMKVDEAIKFLRSTGDVTDNIYTCFVTDSQKVLKGTIRIEDLLFAKDNISIYEIMDEDVIKASTTDDREEVANLFSTYDLISLPVVDQEGRLVGTVTVDDAIDVMEQEATEDIQVMNAMVPEETPYLKTSTFRLAKNRIVWLLILMISGIISGKILANFEEAIAALPILVTFVPMLTDTGGNAGSQSSTMIIRSMAIGDIQMKDGLRVLWKELRVSLMVGLALALVNFIRMIITYRGMILVSLTVSIAMYATVIMAKCIGSMLPIAAKALKMDPALMAAPLITTIVDACALLIYFSVAGMLLHI